MIDLECLTSKERAELRVTFAAIAVEARQEGEKVDRREQEVNGRPQMAENPGAPWYRLGAIFAMMFISFDAFGPAVPSASLRRCSHGLDTTQQSLPPMQVRAFLPF